MSESSVQQGSKTQKKYLLSRLIDLKNYLTKKITKSSPRLLDIGTFSEKLLGRAPATLIETLTTEQLASLTEEGLQILEEAHRNPTTVVSRISSETSGIIVALKDRPFIVSTLIEAGKSFGLTIHGLLHPIFSVQGTTFSLSYLYLPDAQEEDLIKFQKEINTLLNCCIAASEDFSAMKIVIERYRGFTGQKNFIEKFISSDNQEIKQFIDWILDESFIFLGTVEHTTDGSGKLSLAKNQLGLFAQQEVLSKNILKECHEDIELFKGLNEPLWLSKLSELSPVHRRVRLSHLFIAGLNDAGSITSVLSIVGIFSSKASSQEGQSIPLIRAKLRSLLESDDLVSGSHDFKFITDTINRMPKEEAIRLNRDGLRDIVEQTIDVYTRSDSQVSIRLDASKRGASVVVLLPLEWYSEATRVEIEACLQTFFQITPSDSESYIDTSAHGLARLYYHISFASISEQEFDSKTLNQQIRAITESFDSQVIKLLTDVKDRQAVLRHLPSFSDNYRATHSPQQAIVDSQVFQTLNPSHAVCVRPVFTNGTTRIDIYTLESERTLSSLLPVLEHAGFSVIKDRSTNVTLPDIGKVSIHRFEICSSLTDIELNAENLGAHVCIGLEEILKGNAENDVLTSLMVSAGLHNRQILMLRSYTSHLWQFNIFPRKHQIREALSSNPKACQLLWQYFEARFNPQFLEDRKAAEKIRFAAYEDEIRKEKDISKDRTLRALGKLVAATLRTNYYQPTETLAHKIDPTTLDFVPEPRPWREIFVHSFTIEGVHLRTGPVSRGGLRWSERPDDFRTEVLGLVKTQKVKNVFIVPEGAKGGFIVRNLPSSPSAIPSTVKDSYKEFIRALLSLADNRSNEKVIPPQLVVRKDGDDPYFVVAADKGTATFSDTANAIAIDEAKFWLDDAFASGGSNGYDHKIYGITARGGWECVLRHFNDLGIDYLQQNFTAVGIGDMAGDVFGNGLILNDNLQLIAAFNHKHIFIDPTPDSKKSFAERKRLFDNPSLQWLDYNKALISNGGGIYNRADKEIELSAAARSALGIESDQKFFSGEEVIQAILKAPVDLLWNGGIGTYIKSSTETHTQVNDTANDRVRVSAHELRCRIIGEGGNLGLTQKARIEFSALGGRLNTDAIDNSGGVGLSDREVNLKILFSGLMASGKITREERNILLKQMAHEVCDQVLVTNRAHAYRLTVSSERSVVQHEFFKGFISFLQTQGYLNRTLDSLPQDDEIYRRLTNKQGFFRPELAICIASAKMWVKSLVLKSSALKSNSLEKFLIDYFPEALRTRFINEIKNHPLRDTIIATQATNYLVDILGISFFHRLMNSGNFSADVVLNAALSALIVFDAPKVIIELQKLDIPSSCQSYIKVRSQFESSLRSIASWFAYRPDSYEKLDVTVSKFGKQYFDALETIYAAEINSSSELDDQALAILDTQVFKRLNTMSKATQTLDLYALSLRENIPVNLAYQNVEELKKLLGLAGQAHVKRKIVATNRWEHALRRSSLADIDASLMKLAGIAAQKKITTPEKLKELVERSPSYDSLILSINELTNIAPSVAHLAVIAGQFRDFVIVE
jgi:glutamate dehydrogenase